MGVGVFNGCFGGSERMLENMGWYFGDELAGGFNWDGMGALSFSDMVETGNM